ncbi:hypothetical protein PENTCL1PPCAC_26918 [Pristionchus entomophagus]|uniref:Glb-16 n=1 Tax=Pristionchus entomophagus TaxID=358040 RepID=A0AAV5UCS1_9BILA|nr:hypothetical protein PENTCL1PPCAC_26918 [Pristionchus entomophagus]
MPSYSSLLLTPDSPFPPSSLSPPHPLRLAFHSSRSSPISASFNCPHRPPPPPSPSFSPRSARGSGRMTYPDNRSLSTSSDYRSTTPDRSSLSPARSRSPSVVPPSSPSPSPCLSPRKQQGRLLKAGRKFNAQQQHRQLLKLFTHMMVRQLRQKTDGGSSFESGEQSNESSSRASMRRTSSMPSVSDGKVVAAAAAAANVRHYDYDRKLNKMQKKALRFTWHRLQTRNGGKRVENVFEEVFDRLVRQLPCIRDMFTTRTFLCAMSKAEMASLRDHAKITVKMLDMIIRNLDQEKGKRTDTGSNLDPRLLGRAHGPLRPYGLTGIFWEKLGETIIDVVLAQEAVRDLPGAGQAWVVLTACLVDQMRAGFDEARNATFESKQKASVVLHHATMRLASVDSPEPPFLARQHSEDREVHPSTAGPRGYSVDVSASNRGYCPFSLHHQRSIDDILPIDDEELQPSPRGSRLSSRRQTPPTPSSPSTLPPSPSNPIPPLCSRSPSRTPSTGSSNIIVHI